MINVEFSKGLSVTYYEDENKLILPKQMEYFYNNCSTYKELTTENIIYATKYYVAYADLKIKITPEYLQGNRDKPKEYITLEVDNITRKESYGNNKDDLNKITKGIKQISEYNKYVKECGNDIKKASYTPKFV